MWGYSARADAAQFDPIALTMHSLRLDRVAAEVSDRLRSDGLECILIKGSSTARWLYAEGEVRPYVDIDLLIDVNEAELVNAHLRALGFESSTEASGLPEIEHAHNWSRGEGDLVDLHFDLPAARSADPHLTWSVLRQRAVFDHVGGSDVLVLDHAAKSVVVVLHAINSGSHAEQPMRDLQRLISRLDDQTWQEAVSVVGAMGLEDTFSAGLRMTREGEAVADRLDLVHPTSTLLQLKSTGHLNSAIAIDRILHAPSVTEAVGLVVGEFLPSPQGLRRLTPLARRGRWGLLAAYVVRPLVVLSGLPRGLRSWLRARRQVQRRDRGRRATS